MDQNFLVLVGTNLPFSGHEVKKVNPKGSVRGVACWRGSVCSDMTKDLNTALDQAEQSLVASAINLGANVVNNVRCVELQHGNYSGIVLMGDAWEVVTTTGSTLNGAASNGGIGLAQMAQTPSGATIV